MRTDSHLTKAGAAGDVFEFPCSLAQQRFWLLDQVNSGGSHCNIPLRWRLQGKLDPGMVEKSFQRIIERHETLRTWFREDDGQPVQVVVPRVDFRVALIDLRQASSELRQQSAERIRQEDANRAFDLAAAPLLRVTLLRFSDNDHLALVTLHHLICDGWSTGLLAQEFSQAYEALAEGKTPRLAELPLQYADYAVWEGEALAAAGLSAESAYWKQQLAGLKYFELTADFPRAPGRGNQGALSSLVLPSWLIHSVREFSRAEGVTTHTTALAALYTLLWKRGGGQEDIAIGSQIAGRSQLELEGLIGVFINTLVLRTQVSGSLSFLNLLEGVDATLDEAIVHQEMPFERLVAELRPRRDPNRTPFFSVNLIYQRAFIEERDFAGISLQDMNFDAAAPIYDLNFYLWERGEQWQLFCEYSPELFAAKTIERMLQNFRGILQQAMENPRLAVERFSLDEGTAPRSLPSPGIELTAATPSNRLTRQMTEIWEAVLGISIDDPDADFFELGGHSLLATRLLSRIEMAFGRKIKLATLFQSPTIRQLTEVLEGGQGSGAVAGMIGIQPKGTKTPVFCLHGVPSMALLAHELGDDQPFYAVHLPEGTELKAPYTVEAIAAVHVKTIRKFQPQGPYFLLGWCREGLLAYEVAQQIRQQGEEVGMLTMFDTWKPNYPENLPARENRRAERQLKYAQARIRLQELRQMGMFAAARNLAGVVATRMADSWRHLRWQLNYRSELKSGAARPRSQDEMLFLAVDHYVERPYPGRVLLFRSDKYRTWKYWDRMLGWGSVLPQLELHEIAGVHDSMLTGPALPEIARQVAAVLESSSADRRPQKKLPQNWNSPSVRGAR